MKVKRIIANIAASDPASADSFYRSILGLSCPWITAGSAPTPGQLK